MLLRANWSLGSSLRSGSISLKPAFKENLLVLVKRPCKLGGIGDEKDLVEVSLGWEVMGGSNESDEQSAIQRVVVVFGYLIRLQILVTHEFLST